MDTGSRGREGKTTAPDGRTLTYLETGPADGNLVLHNHGGPSCRLEAELVQDAAEALGLRIVCVDRPGQGRSSPQRARTYKNWTDDLLTVADSFGSEKFAVTGWSEGGPWALAAAAYLDPERLVHVACIAGGCYGTFGTNWAAKYLSKLDAFGGRLAVSFSPGFSFMYWTMGMMARHITDSYLNALVKTACPYDREIFEHPGVKDILARMSKETFAQGSYGLVRDAKLLYEAWPFDVTRIERPVHIWQGSADTFVPEPINRIVAERTPGAVYHEIADAGHFIAVGEDKDIFRLAAVDLGA